MPTLTRRQIQRAVLKEMILRECACQDQEETRSAHGVKFHNNGPAEESGMIRSNLYTLSKQAREIHDMIGMNDDLDEWVQEKIAVASSMIDAVYDYIGYEYESMKGNVSSHDSFNPDIAYHDDVDDDYEEYTLNEVTPPGKEKMVKGLKKVKGVNPWAVAWADYNKDAGLNEEDFEDLDAEEVMRRPWRPMHQSTGIMMFEDELDYEPTA